MFTLIIGVLLIIWAVTASAVTGTDKARQQGKAPIDGAIRQVGKDTALVVAMLLLIPAIAWVGTLAAKITGGFFAVLIAALAILVIFTGALMVLIRNRPAARKQRGEIE